MIETVGIVGLGAFGTFAKEQIQKEVPRLDVRGWDISCGTSEGLHVVLRCDVVIFAVRPKVYESVLREMVPHMRPDGIVVDVCGAKVLTTSVLREICDGRPYIASHPMFGRQSWLDQGRSLKGLQLVICEHTLNDAEYRKLRIFLEKSVKLAVVLMKPEEHDEAAAVEQLLTQRIGVAVKRAGFNLNSRNIHTLSAKYFYHAMEIVKHDEELFKEVSAINPFWPKVWAKYQLAEAQTNLDHLNGTVAA
jgi:prephenate dehydrogenase